MAAELQVFERLEADRGRRIRLYVPAGLHEGARELGELAIALVLREPVELVRPLSSDEPAARRAISTADLALGEPECGVAVRWTGVTGRPGLKVRCWIPATQGRGESLARALVANASGGTMRAPAALVESALLGTRPQLCFDGGGRLLYANPAARFVLGPDAQQLAAKLFVLAPEGRLASPSAVVADGRRLLVDPRRALDGDAFILSFDDLGSCGHAPPESPEAEQAAASLAALAHDLRNPIACAAANLRYVKESLAEAATPAEVREALDDALEGLASAMDLLNDATGLSRSERPAPGERGVTVPDVIEHVVRVARRRLGDAARIAVEPDDVPLVAAGPTLVRILLNLLLNAGTALRDAGRPGDIVVRFRGIDGAVEIEVEVDGPGIEHGDRERLFRPYFTTRRDRGGTGLGLAASRRHAEAAGGSLELVERSAPGATFRLRLPAAQGA